MKMFLKSPQLPIFAATLASLLATALAQADHSGRVRSDIIPISTSELNASRGSQLRFPLFDDTAFDITVTRIVQRENGRTIHGTINGETFGTCTITVEGGIVSGGFWSEKGTFGIVPAAPADNAGIAICEVEQLGPEGINRCYASGEKDLLPPGITREALISRRAPHAHVGVQAGSSNEAGTNQATLACDCSDDQSIVDVLCVYTTKAKNAAGGLANLQSRFQNAIDAANGAYTNSGINTGGVNRLELRVAGYVETTYDEVSPEWINHLQRITATNDGFMDNVHALRDQYKADTVSLVVDDTRFTGGAAWWAIWDQGQAFSCINWRATGGGDLLLAHEIGHNFGCAHDHANDSSAPTSYAWGHNFTYNGQTYGTIMSYPGTIRLQQFSNPYMIHAPSGQPLGVPAGQPGAAFNALMIRQTRWTLASYRDSARIKDCNGNGIDDAIDISSGLSQDVNGDCRPDECEERRYVDAQTPGFNDHLSWGTASGDPSEVLGIANLNCSNISQVWFADGTYKPGSGGTDRYAGFAMRSGLAFYGGFQGKSRPGGGESSLAQRNPSANISIISGEIGNPLDLTDNSYSPVNAINTNASAVLNGFTITKGYSDWSGAGLYIQNASPTIADCIFTQNRAGYGGAVTLDAGSSPLFSSCTFDNNTAMWGGGAITVGDSATFTADLCTFSNNSSAWGGAISGNNASINLRTSTLKNNHATQYNGGAVDVNNVQLNLANSLLTGNTSMQDGAALWLANSTNAAITNCTIANNVATTYTGGATVYFASATINNSIFWGNTGTSAGTQDKNLIFYSSTGATRYSRVQGWNNTLGGPANSGANPAFVSPGTGDFSLGATSSCIDGADGTALPLSFTLDLAGHTRRVNLLDIGAYEFGASLPCPADFNNDGMVDDSDFVLFSLAYNILDCADPSMPSGCPCDINDDGIVDDSDFSQFALAYDALLCP